MINHSQRAMELFKQGYNCSQSVFVAFHEDMDIDLETALKLSPLLVQEWKDFEKFVVQSVECL